LPQFPGPRFGLIDDGLDQRVGLGLVAPERTEDKGGVGRDAGTGGLGDRLGLRDQGSGRPEVATAGGHDARRFQVKRQMLQGARVTASWTCRALIARKRSRREPQRLRGGLIQPLLVIDHADQRLFPATSDSKLSTASATRNRSGGGPAASPNAVRSASRCGPSAGRHVPAREKRHALVSENLRPSARYQNYTGSGALTSRVAAP